MKNKNQTSESSDLGGLIRQSNVLLGILVKTQLRDVMAKELADPKKRKLYELTDGTTPVGTLSTMIGMSAGAISAAWKHWDECGLVVKEQGRYRRAVP